MEDDGQDFLAGVEFDTVDVFLSYNHVDNVEDGRASALYDRLTAAGYSVWYDKAIRGGDNWQTAIQVYLRRCRLVVALWSKRSLASDWCKVEAINAAAARKLFPVLMEELGRADFSDAMHDATVAIQRTLYGAPDLMEQIAAHVSASRAGAERRRQASANAILASKKTHLPEVLQSGQPDLFGREVEESILLDAWTSCAPGADIANKTNLVVLYAIGGAGKTALLRRLVDSLAANDFPDAAKVIGWSAYSQGSHENSSAEAGTFISEALDNMGFAGEKPVDEVARARLLAAVMQRRPTLLLLDGIEPLQSPPHVNFGRLKDKGLAVLLVELARDNPGLVVITSRQRLPETEKIARVRNYSLAELAPSAGATLLKHLGCWGAAKDLEAATVEADGHALTLTALGGYIEAVEDGDIRRRDKFKLGEIELTAEEMTAPDETVRAAKKAARVMQRYVDAFAALDKSYPGEGVSERVLLNIVGLFDRAAEGKAVNALLGGEVIVGLTDAMAEWIPRKKAARIKAAKKRLRTLNLLTEADPGDEDGVDAHPIVRAYFARMLREGAPGAFRAAHELLYRMYAAASAKELPDTLDEMTPLFHAIGHACAAGLHQEAFDEVYTKRVRRGNESFINKQLGAFGSNLGALAHFFDTPWGTVSPNLSPPDRAAALNYAAFCLRSLGRPADAEEAESASLALWVEQENWQEAAISAGNLSLLRLGAGNVVSAVAVGANAVRHADRSGDTFWMIRMRTAHADALVQAGWLDEALALFADAEARQAERQPELPRLYSLGGYNYCGLLLALGLAAEVRERSAYALEISTERGLLLDIGLDTLADGCALALLAAHGQADATQALARLDAAVAALRRAGTEHHIPRGLFARAAHLRRALDFAGAGKDLDEVLEIAERGAMKLFLADHALEAARLALAHVTAAPPEVLLPLAEKVELVTVPSPKLNLVHPVLGNQPERPPPAQRRQDNRLVSRPPATRTPVRGPLGKAERGHLANAENQWAEAWRLVQETGYHRRDQELKDLRARLDALKSLN